MVHDTRPQEIGLALSGGAVLGAAHVGVLRALEEEGIRTGWVAGTSAGAIVGALHAFSIRATEIEKLIGELSWLNVANFRPTRMGLLSNAPLGEFLVKTLGDVNLEDAPIPLAVVAADIHTGKRQALQRGNLAKAVTASACIPGIFAPVEWEGRLLVDGGIVEYLPIGTAHSLGAVHVLGVALHIAGLYPEPRSVVDIVLNASSIMMSNVRHAEPRPSDVIITPELTAYNAVDTSHVSELMTAGYQTARRSIDEIRGMVA